MFICVIQKLEELHVAVEGSGATCVLVQGPSGCGKSSLLREYAAVCGYTVGDSVMVLHLGEQIDSKVYTCMHVWLRGVLSYILSSKHCVLPGYKS